LPRVKSKRDTNLETIYFYIYLSFSFLHQLQKCLLHWLLNYSLFYVPLEGLQKLGLCLALKASEQGGIFIVWHGALVFPVSSEGPSHSVATYIWRFYSNLDPRGQLEKGLIINFLFWYPKCEAFRYEHSVILPLCICQIRMFIPKPVFVSNKMCFETRMPTCEGKKVGQNSRSRSGGQKLKLPVQKSCHMEHTYEIWKPYQSTFKRYYLC
jgi:hypothetical protein